MISSLRPSDQLFLNNLNRVSERMNRAQRQLSTGVRMARVSDDPDQVSTLLNARASLAGAQQIQSNLGRVSAEVDAGEQALQSSVQLFERARTLAAQGVTGTQTASGRAVTAQEIGSIMEQLAGLAGTQVEGRYVFSGDADHQVPYTIDLSLPTPVSSYLGANSSRLVQHPNGTTFQVAQTAQEIFDSSTPGANVFASLSALRDALNANDEAAIRAAMDGMTTVSDHLNSALASHGSFQNKISSAKEFGQTLELQLKTQIGGLEDADATEAILQLNQGQIQQQAALTSRAQLPRTTLFDFLG
ncbi:MAG: flagellin [Bryobacteraceae bacterium]